VKTLLISYFCGVCFVVAFLADQLPLAPFARKIMQLTKSSIQTMGSALIADAEKSKILLANSLAVFIRSAQLSGLLLVVLLAGALLLFSADLVELNNGSFLLRYLATMHGILLSVFCFACYHVVKKLYARPRL
jgi:hypothetical protein